MLVCEHLDALSPLAARQLFAKVILPWFIRHMSCVGYSWEIVDSLWLF